MRKIHAFITIAVVAALLLCTSAGSACTSAIVSSRASATGRPLLWKHRDTGADNNFLARVEPTDSTHGYVGLFNGGDSLLTEVWMGMNDCGFAIMNTATYNLAPDTARVKDREGVVMALALAQCATVDDFAKLLARLPKPMGVQANFGVIDAHGGAAYFETDDYSYVRFDVNDDPRGYIVRTNFSITGTPEHGSGYIRFMAAETLLAQTDSITPATFTEGLSRSFYHGLTKTDYLAEGEQYVFDSDFIPRDISTASIVIEGIANQAETRPDMWAVLGYPPLSPVGHVTLDSIPDEFGPTCPGYTSPACTRAMDARAQYKPFKGGSSRKYLDLGRMSGAIGAMHRASMDLYKNLRPEM